MPFEARANAPKKIAVIGAGISGMGAAHMLSEDHHVTLYEAEPRLGGHARTIVAGKNGDQPVDTGFIVFNYANYPHLARLFKSLDVPVTKSNMSFGASLDGGRIEYALATLGSVFAQKKNMVNPKFLRMLADIAKFNKRALDATRDRNLSLGAFLEQIGTGEWFRDYYLLPLTGAIWSTPTDKIMDFPAHALVQFMENHALLSVSGQHQWYTVQGGSVEYVRRLEASMKDRGVTFRLGAPIDAVRRDVTGPEVKAQGAKWEQFDEVVFATHSDDTLRLLSDATPLEKRALGAITYQPNRIILHADPSIMPTRRVCWSSWNYTESAAKELNTIDLTYWMNSLQPIPENDPHFVTLNTTRPIREELIYDECTLRHPVYDLEALAAQDTVRDMNGTNRTWFCGAWMKNGFHEDGLGSAVDVVDAIRARNAVAVAAE
ncbi:MULTISPECIES: NAD(P)/FAD-dependent oxidoreductase [Marivita]|uniref:FAD-dependent oxidoreductase n=1 Tax=Marivita cryptomonadis TaxID=505252 RepID=A0A9Q2NU12_9RHOB|nr:MULTISPECIES: FAD-dependent oxidoreductase [Marivita]MCR9166861.1 FAD-dependent oxidoreductase [Paracoccaceae bacterium]MBM2322999.1 FAD-dependent oxidoreductase [Marivita cryptomonadis]MBM2332449.1 FAD-dependent oxidoreductase [Marivita cryptomonadis]MBM2342032.1 FAD-dependent oxidoreductase [Marivita cryptomonadis]MBM2346829.1 FAD-dependent oxidoreductase [Marivita cryptomonadis]